MVVPLKITQFYGHNVPRPHVYADVKFSEQRVDPPLSVNEALLSWASDAHWSMGGLSIKCLRVQGKVEGSLRRLRGFLEDDDDVAQNGDSADIWDAMATKEATRPADRADTMKSLSRKEARKLVMKKKSEQGAVEAMPARKLRKKEMVDDEDLSEPFLEAEGKRQKGKVRLLASDVRDVASANIVRREGMRSSAHANVKGMLGSKSPVHAENHSNPTSEGGRLIRSVKNPFAEAAPGSPLRQQPRIRKILVTECPVNSGDSSEREDSLDVPRQQRGCSMRRSLRLVKE